jgi:D-alanyl-lipoteichoic acid acyltransferase DltB (MBOAT superfamily)
MLNFELNNIGFTNILFYPILGLFFCVYWFVKFTKTKNILLFLTGYIFYFNLDKSFLTLLICFTLFTYSIGLLINNKKEKIQKTITGLAITICAVTLLAIKLKSNSEIANYLLLTNENKSRNFIIPLGISFYFLHGITYLIDIYKKRIKAEKNIINYAIFINFFPLLIAGPIERANNLIPQIKKYKKFNYQNAVSGLKHILWGLVQKMIISNLCAPYSNQILDSYHLYSGSTIYLALIIYAVNIYADFAGYSNIAIGISKLFGFEVQKNFYFPYFSTSVKTFWQRWHISLSIFFRDYIYIPLGGKSLNKLLFYTNILCVFILSGVWHGTKPNFLLWGTYHFIIYSLFNLYQKSKWLNKINPFIRNLINTWLTFNLVSIGWIFFRSKTVFQSFDTLKKLTSKTLFQLPDIIPKQTILVILIFIILEWYWFKKGEYFNTIEFNRLTTYLRWGIYLCLITLILYYSSKEEQFIYFQF